jgi:hypothetical protein
MTIASGYEPNIYTGNGAASVYPFDFKIVNQSHLSVKVVLIATGAETALTITTDYTVTGVGDEGGGSITLVDNSQVWLDASGDLLSTYQIVLERIVPISQDVSIKNQATYYASTHEAAFDKLCMIDQQQQVELSRALRLDSTVDPDAFDPTVPTDGTAG